METVKTNNSPKKAGKERKESDSLVTQGERKAAGKEPKEVRLSWGRPSLILRRSEGVSQAQGDELW